MGSIKSCVAGAVIGLFGGLGIVTGFNYYINHNVSYETDDKRVFKKADGIFRNTTLKIDKNNDSIYIVRSHPDYRTYDDKNGNEILDEVCFGTKLFTRGSHYRCFDRDKHLEQYPLIFQEADEDFKQQIQRFEVGTEIVE